MKKPALEIKKRDRITISSKRGKKDGNPIGYISNHQKISNEICEIAEMQCGIFIEVLERYWPGIMDMLDGEIIALQSDLVYIIADGLAEFCEAKGINWRLKSGE